MLGAMPATGFIVSMAPETALGVILVLELPLLLALEVVAALALTMLALVLVLLGKTAGRIGTLGGCCCCGCCSGLTGASVTGMANGFVSDADFDAVTDGDGIG